MPNVAIAAWGSVRINDRARVTTPMGQGARVTNTGSGETNIGTDVYVGNVRATGPIMLRERATIAGYVQSGSGITTQNGVSIQNGSYPNRPDTMRTVSWNVSSPLTTTHVTCQPRSNCGVLAARDYADAAIGAGATIELRPGSYSFGSFHLEPDSRVIIRGPTRLLVRGDMFFRGRFEGDPGEIFVTYLGKAMLPIERAFAGTLVSPNAKVSLASLPSGLTHQGAFYAKDIEVHQDARVVFVPFGASGGKAVLRSPWIETATTEGLLHLNGRGPTTEATACPDPASSPADVTSPTASDHQPIFVTRDDPVFEGTVTLNGDESVTSSEDYTTWNSPEEPCWLDPYLWLAPESGNDPVRTAQLARAPALPSEQLVTGPAVVPWRMSTGRLLPGQIYRVGAARWVNYGAVPWVSRSPDTSSGASGALRVALDPGVAVIPIFVIHFSRAGDRVDVATAARRLKKYRTAFDRLLTDEDRQVPKVIPPSCHTSGNITTCSQPLTLPDLASRADTYNQISADDVWERCHIQFQVVGEMHLETDVYEDAAWMRPDPNYGFCKVDQAAFPFRLDIRDIEDLIRAKLPAPQAQALIDLRPVWAEFADFSQCGKQGGWRGRAAPPDTWASGHSVIYVDAGSDDWRCLAAHELGHIIGLFDHDTDPESIMSSGCTAKHCPASPDGTESRAVRQFRLRYQRYLFQLGLTTATPDEEPEPLPDHQGEPTPSAPVLPMSPPQVCCAVGRSVSTMAAEECTLVGGHALAGAVDGCQSSPGFCCVDEAGAAHVEPVCTVASHGTLTGLATNPLAPANCVSVCCHPSAGEEYTTTAFACGLTLQAYATAGECLNVPR